MNKSEKLKWYIIGYILYVIIILYLAKEEYQWSRSEFWPLCFVWCVIIPLVGYTVILAIRRFFCADKLPKGTEISIDTSLEISVPLIDFAREHGTMKIRKCIDSLTGKPLLKECVFTRADGTETHVWVANNIKSYSTEDISKDKEDLYVMTMPSGEYCLCIPWEDVEL